MRYKKLLLPLLILTALAAVSCVSELDKLFTREVRFGASSGYPNGVATRTVYSGVDEDGYSVSAGSGWERIDWLSTDVVRIMSPEATTASSNSPQHYADYTVNPGEVSNQKHNATLAPHDGNGLEWSNENEHHFYAIYPSPLQNNVAGIELNEDGITAIASGYVPRDQDGSMSGYTYKPNMDYAYMYAQNMTRTSSEVKLTFYPLVTTFEFTLLAADDDMAAKTLTAVSVSSEQDGARLSGSFGAEVSPSGLGTVTATGTTETTVSLDLSRLPNGGVQLNRSNPYTFTLFTLPFAQTKLTLRLGFSDGTTRSLALKDNGSWITVPARSKVYIRNLGVPGADWVYTIDPLQSVTLGYKGGSGQLSQTSTFRSIRTKGSVTEVVPYKLQYSEDNGATWTDDLPDWLDATSPSSYGGSTTGETLTLSMEGQEDHAEDVHRAALLANEAKTDFDLSTINVRTGQTVATTTANCYVVQAPGTYKLPLVYGNALVDGAVNESAFRAREGVGGDWRADEGTDKYLGRFTDHLDAGITSPYISTQHSGKALTADLLWQDVKGLVTDVAISGSGTGAYLTFSVPEENIFQGNAVVAVKANGKVAWSWHIWVTDADLTVLTEVSDSYMMPQYNLGWREVRDKNFPAREVKVRAVQVDPRGTSSDAVNVVQTEQVVTIPRYCTFYQWGRKDPIWPSITGGEIFDANGNPQGGSALYSNSSTLGTGIQRAAWILRRVNGDLSSWCALVYDNCWDSTYDGNHTSPAVVTKTIYDPSPVGFKIPPHTAYSGFSGSTFTWDPTNKGRVYNGLFFPANGYRHYERMILTNLSTAGFNWTATPVRSNQTARVLRFYDPESGNVSIWSTYLSNGFSVRPVADTE